MEDRTLDKDSTKLKTNSQHFAEEAPESKDPETEETTEEETPEVEEVPEQEEKEPEAEPETEVDENEKEPEAEEEGTEEVSEELEQLRTKLEEAQTYKAKYEEAKAYKEQYEQTQEALKGYEDSLKKIAEEKIEALPEEFRGLVPEGTTQEKLDWLAKAEESGLYKTKEEKSIGSSSRMNHKESQEVDPVEMTANQKMIAGIKEFYSRSK